MTKLGIFVGEENWTFFNEIFNDLSNHFNVEVFKKKTYNIPLLQGRLNSLIYREGMVIEFRLPTGIIILT